MVVLNNDLPPSVQPAAGIQSYYIHLKKAPNSLFMTHKSNRTVCPQSGKQKQVSQERPGSVPVQVSCPSEDAVSVHLGVSGVL